MDPLEKQLAELQVSTSRISNRPKKVPPAVPPKKKAQPQVPQSATVRSYCEPSYSSKLSNTSSTSPLKNTFHNPELYGQKDYVNFNNNDHSIHKIVHNNAIAPYNNNSYSRVHYDDALPPPPPPPLPVQISTAQHHYANDNNEYISPPSPVSSNYSELVRATNPNYQNQQAYAPIYQNQYNSYSGYQGPNYESLYEPINVRPQSQMSSQSNMSPTHSYSNNSSSTGRQALGRENEVDCLTDLLVKSISDSQDLDVFGTCVKCRKKVIDETSGCTAMGHTYHVKCFSCQQCNSNLQGKPFYAVDGQPFCEKDYMDTLEKCCVCSEPILDRILRATGKPYHPRCFTCVVCGKSLDGIPFTVDAMNQIHCIEDFHKKFAPRCCVCELPIMPEEGEEETVRVVALDRSFHVSCYRCEDCGLLLSSESEGRGCYPLDGHILCKSCNAHRIRLLTNVITTDL